jgi:hypothetical protein
MKNVKTARPMAALVTTVAAALLVVAPVTAGPAEAAAKTYKNCDAMHRDYPHGVGKPGARDRVSGASKPVTTFTKSAAVYAKNTKSDRDKDGIACEKR